jgi:hypothetical protein
MAYVADFNQAPGVGPGSIGGPTLANSINQRLGLNRQGVPVAAPVSGVEQSGSFYPGSTQTNFEKQAGVNAQQYYSMLDANGQLKSPFAVDPTKSDSFNQMKATANSTALSPWAAMQEKSLGLQTSGLRDQTNAQQQGANDTAMQQLMTQGGGSNSGARALVAAMGSKANIMANQNIGSQAAGQDLGIQQADAQNKAQMLGQVANTETSALGANAQTGINDLAQENTFASNRYNQQMQAWGAAQTANAQAAAAGGGKK